MIKKACAKNVLQEKSGRVGCWLCNWVKPIRAQADTAGGAPTATSLQLPHLKMLETPRCKYLYAFYTFWLSTL